MCLFRLLETQQVALLTAISFKTFFSQREFMLGNGAGDVCDCMDMYLHNYPSDAHSMDIPNVKTIWLSALFSRNQTDPIRLMF